MDVRAIAQRTAQYKAQQIASLQDVKQTARQRAKELDQQRQANTAKADDLRQERDLTNGHNLDLFVTPDDLAGRMVRIANIKAGDIALEPSAGTGRICKAIATTGATLEAVELSYNATQLLRKHGYTVYNQDFLTFEGGPYDAVIMNPPFSNGQDIDHVRHAYGLLKDSGRLVAIVSAGAFQRSDSKARDFQAWVKVHRGHAEQLPEGTFKASGTMVNAYLLTIIK